MKLFVVLCLALCFIGCNSHQETTKTTSLTIQLKQCANQSITWTNPYTFRKDTIRLDSAGSGVITIPANLPKRFITVYAYCANYWFTVFMDSGYDLVLHTNEKTKHFTGNGSTINNYLCKIDSINHSLFDSIFNIREASDINQLASNVEQQYIKLFNTFFKNDPLSKEMEYVLKTHSQAAVLNLKQSFVYNFQPLTVDSLDLVNKLGLNTNELLNDTLLLTYNSSYFKNYLTDDLNFSLLRKIKPNEDANVNTLNAINSIENATQYNKEIKKYLFFYLLHMDIQQTGVNHFKDSIINALVAQKKISVERNQQLISLKQKYNHLLPGNPAPHLQGVNAEGKLITLKDLKGKVIFIDVWGTGCPPCIEAIPHVMELRNKLQENKEVEFVFLSGDKEDEWKQFLKAHPTFKGTHLRSRGEEDSRYEENWKINGIPRYILIDKQGNIIDAFARNNSYEKLAEMIEKASKK